MLAPMVALMRLPLIAAEARNSGKWAAESALAVNEKVGAMAEGFVACRSFRLVVRSKQSPLLGWAPTEETSDQNLYPMPALTTTTSFSISISSPPICWA